MAVREKLRRVVFLALLAILLAVPARTQSNEGQKQTGKVVSVRKVLRNPYFVSRYPEIHYYLLYFSMRIANQSYCAEYETPVLEEINDAAATTGKDIELVLKEKKVTIMTPHGFKLKAHFVEGKQC
jgi:hypothetical protein